MTSSTNANRLRAAAARRRAENAQTKRTACEPLEWWMYPIKWVGTERFWHEVTTRTLAGVLVVGAGAAVAIAGQWIPGPQAPSRIIALLSAAVAVVAVILSLSLVRAIRNNPEAIPGLPLDKKGVRSFTFGFIGTAVCALLLAVDQFLASL